MKQLRIQYRLTNDWNTYIIEDAREVDSAMWGPCIRARFRRESEERWDEGDFRWDRVRSLEPLLETATATRGEMGAPGDPITASGGATTSEVVANPLTDVAIETIGNVPEVSAS